MTVRGKDAGRRVANGLRLRRGFAWSTISALFIQGSTFIVSVIVANLLGRGPFGEFAMVLSTLLAVMNIAQVATGVITIRYVAEYRAHSKARAGTVIGMCSVLTWSAGTLTSVALVACAPWIADTLLNSPQLTGTIMLGAAAVLFGAVNGYQTGTLAGLESYRALAVANSILGSVHVLLVGASTWIGGLDGAITGLSVSAFLRWLVFARVLRRQLELEEIRIQRRGCFSDRALLWRFAFPAAVGSLTPVPALWLANAFLAMEPGGYAELALYSAANNIRLIVAFLPQILNGVVLSVLNYQLGVSDAGSYRRIFWTNIAGTAGFACIGAAIAALFGSAVLGLYGPSFNDGYPILLVLLLSTVVETVAIACYQLIQSREKMWLSLFLVNIPRDSVIVGLAWLLVPSWGAMGLAIAYGIAWTVALLFIAGIAVRLGVRGTKPSRMTPMA